MTSPIPPHAPVPTPPTDDPTPLACDPTPLAGGPGPLAGGSIDDSAAERALRAYLAAVADAVGVGAEACTVDLGPPVSAYLAVDQRLVDCPDRDTALLWDERYGWAAAVESRCGEDLIVVAFLGADAVPPPAAVATFLSGVSRRTAPRVAVPPPRVGADVGPRLAAYRSVALAS